MRLLDDVPPAIQRCRDLGTEFQLFAFANAGPGEGQAREALGLALERIESGMLLWLTISEFSAKQERIRAKRGLPPPPRKQFDRARLDALTPRELTREEFLGGPAHREPGDEYLDHVRLGTFRMSDGRTLRNPGKEVLKRMKRQGITVLYEKPDPTVELPLLGEFTSKFWRSPHPHRDPDGYEEAEAFDALCEFMVPPWTGCTILDWAKGPEEDLLAVFPALFAPGLEWWGVYLFTVHVPAEGRLTVAAASTTD